MNQPRCINCGEIHGGDFCDKPVRLVMRAGTQPTMYKVRLSETTECHDGNLYMALEIQLPFVPFVGLILYADQSGAESVITRVVWDVNDGEFECETMPSSADCSMEIVAKTNVEYGWQTIC